MDPPKTPCQATAYLKEMRKHVVKDEKYNCASPRIEVACNNLNLNEEACCSVKALSKRGISTQLSSD